MKGVPDDDEANGGESSAELGCRPGTEQQHRGGYRAHY